MSIRMLWNCKDVSTPSGCQGARFSKGTWTGLQLTKSVTKPCCEHVVDRCPHLADLMDQLPHDLTPRALPSSLPSRQHAALVKLKARKFERVALKEATIVRGEDVAMLECADLCKQELNLLTDNACFNRTGRECLQATHVCALVRGIRMHFLDSNKTVTKIAEDCAKTWIPCASAETVLKHYVDWRRNNCTGFTESMKGKNHRFTMLLDSHPDLERDCRDWVTAKTKDKKFRLTVTKFCRHLNEVLIPAHAEEESALVDPKDNTTPYISHTVAWRFMVHLGAKYGALQKGLVQDHERWDVVIVRKKFVGAWLSCLPRMFACRQLNVQASRRHMQPTLTSDSTPFKGNTAQFVAGLKLEGVKDEPPTESEAALVQSWAEGHCDASARTALDDATGESVLVEVDKLDHGPRRACSYRGDGTPADQGRCRIRMGGWYLQINIGSNW